MTMLDSNLWYLSLLAGSGAPYGITGPGSDTGYWDGVPNTTEGSVFTTILTTGDNEPTGNAVITFVHVTPISSTSTTTTTKPTTKPYTYISVIAPRRPRHGAMATFTSIVRPLPPPGHVILQRRVGSAWVNVAYMTFSMKLKVWTSTLRWVYARRSIQTFRIAATAAPGLLTSYGGSVQITTHT